MMSEQDNQIIRKPGFAKLFETHEVRRIPCVMNEETKMALVQSTYQGRIFPQALSEMFGLEAQIDRLELRYEADGETKVLVLLVHESENDSQFSTLINYDQLNEFLPNRWYAFSAVHMAAELLRVYRYQRDLNHGV